MKKFSKAYDMYVSDLITKIETGPLNYDRKIYSALDGYKTLDILTEMYKSNDIDSSDYPKEYVDNRPAENEKISVRIYQLKAIPLPEYIKSIQHADDIQLTDTIIRMLNDMEMYSDKLMNSRGLSIRTNLHKLNELNIASDYSPLGKFFNNSSYEAFKSFMVQDEIIKFYKSRSNIDNDMVTSKDMYIDTKCLVDTITISLKHVHPRDFQLPVKMLHRLHLMV